MTTDMVFGIFSTRENAEEGIENLKTHGFDAKDISVIMKDTHQAEDITASTGASVADSTASGVAAGGVIGGLAGLLVGIGAITIPGIGALLIGGPVAAALGLTGAAATTTTGALTGALAGGVLGALVGIGVPEEDAREYESRIRTGAILVAVPARSTQSDEAKDILEYSGADRIRTVAIRKRNFAQL